MSKRNANLTPKAQKLRKNATAQEKKLWFDFLKNYPIQFKRQTIFYSYIVDFYCPKAQLVIELDGAQHYEEKALDYDENRTRILESTGCQVIRYLNREVDRNFESVCRDIDRHVCEKLGCESVYEW